MTQKVYLRCLKRISPNHDGEYDIMVFGQPYIKLIVSPKGILFFEDDKNKKMIK